MSTCLNIHQQGGTIFALGGASFHNCPGSAPPQCCMSVWIGADLVCVHFDSPEDMLKFGEFFGQGARQLMEQAVPEVKPKARHTMIDTPAPF